MIREERPTRIEQLRETQARAIDALIGLQHDDGHWCAELQGDSILESEYILMKFILGQEDAPMADGRPGRETLLKIGAYLKTLQREDGGWGQFPGSGVDISATVKGYFALKLLGEDPESEPMRKARSIILDLGGAERVNSFSNFYLACLGQVSWDAVPAIPPEIVLLPTWFYFHLSKVSAWTRTMILPLSLVTTKRPTRKLPKELGIDELYVSQFDRHRLTSAIDAPVFWSAFFFTIDTALKMAHKLGGTPVRTMAIARAIDWILKRAGQDGPVPTDGLGAIFPPMVYQQIAFQACGYERDNPIIQRAERDLDAFFIEQDGMIRIQPCFSPVWDTGIALYALTDCGMTIEHDAVRKAARWLHKKECTFNGDWSEHLSGQIEPAGWFFEYNNGWYPDCDDTVMVAMALQRVGGMENIEAAQRGVQWVLSLQNDDGGWAAFDKTKHRQILEYIPFADHNAMQDPSCHDITGRVLECLSCHGMTMGDPAVRRAVEFIVSRQEPEGCFFGRWGVNYIYGTWQAVIGPIRCGVPRESEWIQMAGAWIKSIQNADGSFGESALSYEDPSLKGQGPATASQTSWAAMILQEIYGPDDPDLASAIDWLARTQLDEKSAGNTEDNPDEDPPGSWVETEFTGTGFPKVFYLRYHLYRLYFPVMALGRYIGAKPEQGHEKAEMRISKRKHVSPPVS
ncbi:MAG: squalene--hopene cyclase [Planctomycetota bacterium]|nr:squalene--hopene cyclase [Planctomycetota bacterium]